jgi:hypothetical protein
MCVAAGIGKPFGYSGLYLIILEALRTVELETLRKAENAIIEAPIDAAARRHLRKAIRALAKTETEGL